MKDTYIHSVQDFLALIDKQAMQYPSRGISHNPVTAHFLYRGIDNRAYKLLPGIFRDEITKGEYIEELQITNSKYLSYSNELNILQAFIQEAVPYEKIIREQDPLFKWAELAQHHGVPTRFLDWSKNPLIALYFACENNSNSEAVVWILHATNFDTFSNNKSPAKGMTKGAQIDQLIRGRGDAIALPSYPLIYSPTYFNPRMSAQSSFFMVWGTNPNPLEEQIIKNQYMSLTSTENGEIEYGMQQIEQFIYPVYIYPDRKQSIIRQLDILGINAKTLFPGLSGIGRYIERKYRFDYNEAMEYI